MMMPSLERCPRRAKAPTLPGRTAGATRAIALAGCLAWTAVSAVAPAADRRASFPMLAADWTAEPGVPWVGDTAAATSFALYEGMPTGTMTLNDGIAASKLARFSTGTVDFDMKPMGYDDAGIVFHRRGDADGEFFYIRANPDCPAANDCIQYAPITRTLMGWNIYPNYQRPAYISQTGWNHVRLVVAGGGMIAYLNGRPEPALVVPRLQGLTRDGGIAFKGAAVFANLVIDPDVPTGTPAMPAAVVQPGAVTAWLVAPPTVFERGRAVSPEDAPAAGTWHPIEVEADGLVNLGRAWGTARGPALSLAWAKTSIVAARPARRTLRFGFAPQAWVFLNGHLIYDGRNSYHPENRRLSVDGRLAPDNAAIALDLRRGRNDLVVAVSNDGRPWNPTPSVTAYGWGFEGHIDDVAGLTIGH